MSHIDCQECGRLHGVLRTIALEGTVPHMTTPLEALATELEREAFAAVIEGLRG